MRGDLAFFLYHTIFIIYPITCADVLLIGCQQDFTSSCIKTQTLSRQDFLIFLPKVTTYTHVIIVVKGQLSLNIMIKTFPNASVADANRRGVSMDVIQRQENAPESSRRNP